MMSVLVGKNATKVYLGIWNLVTKLTKAVPTISYAEIDEKASNFNSSLSELNDMDDDLDCVQKYL